MKKNKTKEDFLKWVIYERLKSRLFTIDCCSNFKRYPLKYYKHFNSEFGINLLNSEVNINSIKFTMNYHILEHLNAYFSNSDIQIYYIECFLETVESVDFFKNSKFSTDSQEYTREIYNLKKKADNLQRFTNEQINIRIPILPQISIYSMITYFKRCKLSDKIIKNFTSYFGINKRFRKSNAFKKRCDDFVKLRGSMINSSMIDYGRSSREFILENQFYYLPPKKQFFNKYYHQVKLNPM